ncbi:MAG: hypothetical protein AAGG51_09360 [Cyanobacteria bacterium P01_G01_bin.54]
MSGIDRPLKPNPRQMNQHLPDTPPVQKHLAQAEFAYVFTDEATLKHVTIEILTQGEFLGRVRGHERYGLYFVNAIGYQLSQTGDNVLLYYGEMKIQGDQYHVIPRSKPS